MPAALPKACPRCPGVVPCPRHPPRVRAPWGGTSQSQRTGRPGLSLEIRRAILERDGLRCRCMLPGHGHTSRTSCLGRARQVDHVISRSEGGTDDPRNLASICERCHRLKSSSEGGRARRRWAR